MSHWASAKLVRLIAAVVAATASAFACSEDSSHRAGVPDKARDASSDGTGGAPASGGAGQGTDGQATDGGGSGGTGDAAAGTSGDASSDATVLDASSLDVSTDGMANDAASVADGPCEVSVESGSCIPCPTPLLTCTSVDTSPAALADLVDPTVSLLTFHIKPDSQTAAIQSATVALKDPFYGITIETYDANVSSHAMSLDISGVIASVLDYATLDFVVRDRCGQKSTFTVGLARNSQGPIAYCP